MSAPKKKTSSPFLKKAEGAKPPTRREMKRGLGRGLNALIAPPHAADRPAVNLSPLITREHSPLTHIIRVEYPPLSVTPGVFVDDV